MKRMILAAVLAGAFVLPVAAHAAPAGYCQAVGKGPGEVSCTYVANGAGTYEAANPNDWNITVVRDDATVVLAEGKSPSVPSSGAVASLAGETVTVSIYSNCVPLTPVCGTIGFVASGGQ